MTFKWNFNCTKLEKKYLKMASDRYCNIALSRGIALNPTEVMMDLLGVHKNICELDFEKLLSADDGNFLHDVSGTGDHIDRKNGKLLGHFKPRCAK